MAEFLTYSKFHTKEEAEEFAALLDSNDIPFEVEHTTLLVDPLYVGEDPNPRYLIKLPPAQFETVNKLKEKEMEQQLEQVNPEYYLFQFSNDELKDVARKPDEWNYFDQLLARKLLLERNVALEALPGPVHLHESDQSYTATHLQLPWVILGYVCSIFLSYWGIAMGAGLLIARRTLKDGRKVNIYDQQSRNHGWVMIIIGAIMLALAFSNIFNWRGY